MIRLICPGCEKVLKVNEALAGKTVACPACKSPFQVPAAESAPEEVPVEKPVPPTKRRTPVDDDEDTPPPQLRNDDENEEDRPRKSQIGRAHV